MAADSALLQGNTVTIGQTKIVKRPSDGAIIASTGSAAYGAAFRDWALAGEDRERQPKRPNEDSRAFIFLDGIVHTFETDNGPAFEHRPSYFAVGSGMDFAIGAMWMGASAEEALKAAIEHDAYTRGPILVLREGLADA